MMNLEIRAIFKTLIQAVEARNLFLKSNPTSVSKYDNLYCFIIESTDDELPFYQNTIASLNGFSTIRAV